MSSAPVSKDAVVRPAAPQKSDPTQLSLGAALRGHSNALGLLRLILASLVIFDHAFPLGGNGRDPFWMVTAGQASLGSLAVAGFFAISGYLIAKSGMSADILQFMWRRVLRIFPAYWTVLLFTALFVAPAIWAIQGDALRDYFRFLPNGPLNYFTANWTLNIGTYGIYDLLAETTPYGREVMGSVFNGSIWTLIYEWGCYLMIGVLVAFGVLSKARIVLPLMTLFVYITQVVYLVNPDVVASLLPIMADPQRISLTLAFLFGSCLAVYSTSIPFDDRLGILSGLVLAVTLHWGGFALIGTAAGAYFTMYLGARLPKAVHWIGAKNDYSYGIYIYGFLVQQVLAFFGVHLLGYLPYALIALVISAGLAWLSWHGVEKRAMALKDWGPGRGISHWTAWTSNAWQSRSGRRSVQPQSKEGKPQLNEGQ